MGSLIGNENNHELKLIISHFSYLMFLFSVKLLFYSSVGVFALFWLLHCIRHVLLTNL